MGLIVKCQTCEHQTRYDSSEIEEFNGHWVILCRDCRRMIPVGKVESIEDQIRKAMLDK